MSDTQKQPVSEGATHLTDASFAQALKDSDKPVFVDFFAQWCGPCMMAAPIVDKLADEYKDKIVIAKLDVDENGATAQQYGVMSIPTVIVFKKGADGEMAIVQKEVGFPGEAGYRQMIEKAIA